MAQPKFRGPKTVTRTTHRGSPQELQESMRQYIEDIVQELGPGLFRLQVLHDDITKSVRRVSLLMDFAHK